MDARRAARHQPLAQPCQHLDAEGADRGGVVEVALHLEHHPARYLDAVAGGELGHLGEVVERHHAGHDRHVHTERPYFVDEVKVGVGVEEELGDGRIGASLDLGRKVLQIAPGVALFGVVFGVGGDLDLPVGTLGFADESDQFGGVAKFARHRHAAGQIAAQRDDATDALGAVGGEYFGDAFAGRADTGQVRRGFVAECSDVAHSGQRFLAGRATGAVGDAEELRLQRRQVLHHGLEFLGADGGVGREELDADGRCGHGNLCVGSSGRN